MSSSGPIVPFKLWYGLVASGTGDAAIAVGLGADQIPFLPDFVIVSSNGATAPETGWSVAGTTLTLLRSDTTAVALSYIAALVSA